MLYSDLPMGQLPPQPPGAQTQTQTPTTSLPPMPSPEFIAYQQWQQQNAMQPGSVDRRHVEVTVQKVKYAFYAAIAFFVLSTPVTYRFLSESIGFFMNTTGFFDAEKGAPTVKGIFLHSGVFFVFMMGILSIS